MFERLNRHVQQLGRMVDARRRHEGGLQDAASLSACAADGLALYQEVKRHLELQREQMAMFDEAAGYVLAAGLPQGEAHGAYLFAQDKLANFFTAVRRPLLELARLSEIAGQYSGALGIYRDILCERPYDAEIHSRLNGLWANLGGYASEALAVSERYHLVPVKSFGRGIMERVHSLCIPPGQNRLFASQDIEGRSPVRIFDLEGNALGNCMDRNGEKLTKACVNALVADGHVSQAEVDRRKKAAGR